MEDIFDTLANIVKPVSSVKINVLGTSHDPSKELELFSENEFGFNVEFIYKEVNRPDYKLYKDGEKETYHNVTEFHYLYDLNRKGKSIACESDIHGTGSGGNEKALHIKSIKVTLATKKHRNF